MTRGKGFSLLELVVVLVIAGIVAVLALPSFTDSESKAAWFHEQVKAALRYAQRQAVAQRRCVFVSLSAAAPQVQLSYGNSACANTGTPLVDVGSGAAYAVNVPGAALAPPAPAAFAFDSLGRPTGGGVAFSAGGASISVDAETGYVH